MNKEKIIEASKEFGTPLYLYDETKIIDQFLKFSEAIKTINAEVYYAVKANSSLKILSLLRRVGCRFDTVSGGEIQKALTIGAAPDEIIFSGTGKTKEEIELALVHGIKSINIETLDELSLIIELSGLMNKKPCIAFRFNPEVSAQTHPYISTGLRENKFGMCTSDLDEGLNRLKEAPHVVLSGLSCHIGSGIFEIDALKDAYTRLRERAMSIEDEGFKLSFLDCGGGFGVPYNVGESEFDLERFSEMLSEVFRGSSWKLFFEPGKYLVAEAGCIATKIVSVKSNGDKIFYIVDAGMNDLIRPSLYEAHHQISVLNNQTETHTVDVVGPVCESGCFFAKKRLLKKASVGDVILIHHAGAYGMSMASRYNSRPLPAEVLVNKNGGFELIRKRESFEDLIRGEVY